MSPQERGSQPQTPQQKYEAARMAFDAINQPATFEPEALKSSFDGVKDALSEGVTDGSFDLATSYGVLIDLAGLAMTTHLWVKDEAGAAQWAERRDTYVEAQTLLQADVAQKAQQTQTATKKMDGKKA